MKKLGDLANGLNNVTAHVRCDERKAVQRLVRLEVYPGASSFCHSQTLAHRIVEEINFLK